MTHSETTTLGGDTNGDGNSSAPNPGDWTTIRFRNESNDANSLIQHALIKFAGEHQGNRFGAIQLEGASPTITDNKISQNSWFAISADVDSFPVVTNNQIIENYGNGLEIRGGDMVKSGAWQNTDIVYALTGPVKIQNSATLSIEPGIIVKFVENTYIDIDGSFRAIGNSEQRVIFTSIKDDSFGGDTNGDTSSSAPSPGDWTMIRVYDDSNDNNCIIEYSTIKYAGRFQGDKYGAIHILRASPTISHSIIIDNYFYGIWYDKNSSPNLTDNDYTNNVAGPTFQNP